MNRAKSPETSAKREKFEKKTKQVSFLKSENTSYKELK